MTDLAKPETGQPVSTTGTEAPAPQPPPTATVEELQAQISRLEAAVKDANKEAEKRRKKLDELEAEKKTREDAQVSEADRLQKKLAEYERQAAQLAEENARVKMQHAIERVAAGMNFHSPDEAYLLADLSGVTLDDESGKYAGIEDALKKLATERPHLLKSQPRGAQTAPVPPTPKPAPTGQLSEAEIERRRVQYARQVRQIF
jgi:DNA repair exonuclease SbcCD ATPase subunit